MKTELYNETSSPPIDSILSNDDCLEVKRKIIRTVLCCVILQLYTDTTHEQFLNLRVGSGINVIFALLYKLRVEGDWD